MSTYMRPCRACEGTGDLPNEFGGEPDRCDLCEGTGEVETASDHPEAVEVEDG